MAVEWRQGFAGGHRRPVGMRVRPAAAVEHWSSFIEAVRLAGGKSAEWPAELDLIRTIQQPASKGNDLPAGPLEGVLINDPKINPIPTPVPAIEIVAKPLPINLAEFNNIKL